MAEDVAIALNNVSKCFKRYEKPSDRLKEMLLPGKSRSQEFWALRDINLEVRRGETLGVIGQNGSGKSTLLQIIAKTLTPTTGQVRVDGRVSALLELGSGFNPEFTGRQNVFFNGQILGLSQAAIAEKFDEIARFADIGDFIDQPVKTYSSGMFVRLAFAVAINVDPDVLIVDEALSVGDGIFVHRCMAKIKDFQDAGGTILFVSHDGGAVARLCSQAAWIDSGTLVEVGKPSQLTKHYQAWVYDNINAYQKKNVEKFHVSESFGIEEGKIGENFERFKLNPFTSKPYQSFSGVSRFGTGKAEITSFTVVRETGEPLKFVSPGDTVKILVKVLAFSEVKNPIVGVMIYDRLRTEVTGLNTYQLQRELPILKIGGELNLEFLFKWPELQGGSYLFEAAIADGSQSNNEMLDWLQCPLSIMSGVNDLTFGMIRLSGVQVSHTIH